MPEKTRPLRTRFSVGCIRTVNGRFGPGWSFCALQMQTHEPYTAYAHWMLIQRMLSGAGVNHLQANMDQSSMSRATFLCAFADEVRRGAAHGFYVRYTKFQTIDEREHILAAAKRRRKAFRTANLFSRWKARVFWGGGCFSSFSDNRRRGGVYG